MKIVSQLNATHTLVLVPRYYPTETLTLELTEEGLNTTTTVVNVYSYPDEYLTIVFDYDFIEDSKFQMTLKEGAEVVYRGKLIVTDQNGQDYKQTNGLYYYE